MAETSLAQAWCLPDLGIQTLPLPIEFVARSVQLLGRPQWPELLILPARINTIRRISGGELCQSVYLIHVALTAFRDFAIIIVFVVGLGAVYITATEFITAKKSKGEVLVFRQGHTPAALAKTSPDDAEAANGRPVALEKVITTQEDVSAVIQKQTAIFQWKDVCYDIRIKKEERRILDHVDGWVKPGTLTALMVSSRLNPRGGL